MVQTSRTGAAAGTARPYSAHTTLTLLTGGGPVDLAAVGPRRVRLRTPSPLPAGPGYVVATIDDHVQHWAVTIPDGLDPAETEVPLPTLGPENRHDGPPPAPQ